MNIHLYSDIYGPLPFTKGWPAHLNSQLIPQAAAFHSEGKWGLICMQELHTGKHLLRHFQFFLSSTLSLRSKERNEGLQSLLSLKGQIEINIHGLQPVRVHDNEFILFNAADADLAAVISADKPSSFINTYYSANAVSDYHTHFPRLKTDLKKALLKPFHFIYPAKPARYSVNDAVNDIWLDKYADAIQKKYIELRLETKLFTLLAQTYTESPAEAATPLEREKAAAARDLILKDISVHLTIEELAVQLHCSAPWLKKAFSKVFGLGMFHLLRKTRMERAKEMLLKGESLKIVALEIGMKPRNFPKEFKSYFGYTVTALKKGLH